jgi:hypothetical protein
VYLKAGQSLDYNVQSAYVVTITVKDTLNASSSALLTITLIEANKAPTWVSGIRTWSFTIDEGSTPGTSLIGTPTIQATDPNTRDAITYSIAGCVPKLPIIPFEINPVTAEVTVNSDVVGSLLFNSSAVYVAGPETFYCNITAKDNGLPSMTVNGTMNVRIVNISPRFLAVGSNFTISGSSGAGVFIANFSNLIYTPYSPPTLSYTIANADTTAEGDTTFAVDANTGVATVANASYTTGGMGPPRWNYNTRRRFALTVQATDTTRSRSGSGTYYVNITHVNRPPTWDPIPRMPAPSRMSGNVGTALSLYVSDPDVGLVNETFTFSIMLGNVQNTFAIVPATGQLYVNNVSATNFIYIMGAPYPPTYNLTIRVCDAGRDGPSYCTNANMTVEVTQTNFPPVINAQNFSCPELATVGRVVGTVAANDPDPGQTLQYFLVAGNVDGAFTINATTGSITVINGAVLDFEGPRNSYTLQVQVTDNGPGSLSTIGAITVRITDVGEAPTTNAIFLLNVPENSVVGTVVGTITANDVDAADSSNLKYTFSQASTIFSIGLNTGIITVASAVLDYETTSSYALNVTVTDTYSLTAVTRVQISVNNMNDPPALADVLTSVPENAVATAITTMVATDQDSGQTELYTLSRPSQVCWSLAVTLANLDTLKYYPVLLANLPLSQTVVFRAMSSGSVKVALRVLGSATNDRYEFTIGEAGNKASVRRCNTVCSSPIGASVSVPALSTSVFTNWWVSVQRSTGLLMLGTRDTNDYGSAVFTTLLSVTDMSGAYNVTEVGVSATTAGSRVSSICYDNPGALANGTITLNPTTGVLSTAANQFFNYEWQRVYGVEVQVTDQPTGNSLTPTYLSEYAVVTINVQDVNEVPVWSLITCGGGTYVACFSIAENSAISSLVGTLNAALDPDFNQTQTYTLQLTNNTAGLSPIFSIATSTRQVSVAQAVLDFESQSAYTLTATATDNGSPVLAASASFFVQILDVNEAPVVADQVRKCTGEFTSWNRSWCCNCSLRP